MEIACEVQKLLAIGGVEEMEKSDNEEELAMEVKGDKHTCTCTLQPLLQYMS